MKAVEVFPETIGVGKYKTQLMVKVRTGRFRQDRMVCVEKYDSEKTWYMQGRVKPVINVEELLKQHNEEKRSKTDM